MTPAVDDEAPGALVRIIDQLVQGFTVRDWKVKMGVRDGTFSKIMNIKTADRHGAESSGLFLFYKRIPGLSVIHPSRKSIN